MEVDPDGYFVEYFLKIQVFLCSLHFFLVFNFLIEWKITSFRCFSRFTRIFSITNKIDGDYIHIFSFFKQFKVDFPIGSDYDIWFS